MEVGKAVYAHSPALLDSHSSCPHNSFCFKSWWNLILFPFVKLHWASWPGRPFYVQVATADTRENKASMRPESADGIPQFWRNEKICGRFPSSPPAESLWRCLTFLPSAVVLHGKTYPVKMLKWCSKKVEQSPSLVANVRIMKWSVAKPHGSLFGNEIDLSANC